MFEIGRSHLRDFLASGKKIIITTVQKFPFVLADIGNEHRDSRFAIVIDEAHSSQGGRASAKMNEALSETGGDEVEDFEDKINQAIEQRKMLPNASYFAFTATPKNKTLEIFGTPIDVTTQELRIEQFFPSDDATRAVWPDVRAATSHV